MQIYRRLRGFSTWHWHRNCSGWPANNYVEESRATRPNENDGRLCRECTVWDSLEAKEQEKKSGRTKK